MLSSLAGGRVWSSKSFHPLDCLHKSVKNKPYKIAWTNVITDDEHMMLKTRKWHQELN
jgi:hypothetical protein